MTQELVRISAKYVEESILVIRSKKVILDRVLAGFYGVSTSALNQAGKRNPERMPSTEELGRRIDELQRTYDGRFTIVFKVIRQLMIPAVRKRNPIGFLAKIPRK